MKIEVEALYTVLHRRQSFWERLFNAPYVPDLYGAKVYVVCEVTGDSAVFEGKLGQPGVKSAFQCETDMTRPMWHSHNPNAVFVATFNGVPIPKATTC